MKKFVTPKPLPNPREREILTILMEECAEVQQRASKLLRFGRDEVQPGQKKTNMERLSAEYGDLCAVYNLALKTGLMDYAIVCKQIDKKLLKLEKYMQTKK